jgi:hypothetical protein
MPFERAHALIDEPATFITRTRTGAVLFTLSVHSVMGAS